MMEKVVDGAIRRQEETLKKAAEQSEWIREQITDVIVRLTTEKNPKLEMHSAIEQVYEIAKEMCEADTEQHYETIQNKINTRTSGGNNGEDGCNE